MEANKAGLCTIGLIGIAVLIYYAQKGTGDTAIVPDVQGEAQVMGMGVQAGMRVNAGTPLDIKSTDHGWHPGYDPDPTAQPVMQSRHRYPALPGGNISTVMHQGWAGVMKNAPAGNDWFTTPPEAAVL